MTTKRRPATVTNPRTLAQLDDLCQLLGVVRQTEVIDRLVEVAHVNRFGPLFCSDQPKLHLVGSFPGDGLDALRHEGDLTTAA